MTHKDAIQIECNKYAMDPRVRFIGYNTVLGSRMYGTLEKVAKEQCVETPVCENLMVGLAMGMCLEGYKPVICFERHDFLLIALDALVNHMDKMPWLSKEAYQFPIVVRAIVGSSSPLDPGCLHTQDYTEELRSMLKHTPVLECGSKKEYELAWGMVGEEFGSGAVVVVEYKDLYNKEMD